jgi:hypothetical protein
MNIRPHIAADPAAHQVRPSARVATVADMLDCHPGDVRRLVHAGELEAHGKGIRGIRIFLDSVRAYQDRQAKPRPLAGAPGFVHKPRHSSRASTASFRSALAGLAVKGLV